MSYIQPLEVVDRGSETQPQVGENLIKLTPHDKGQMIPQHVVSCASPSGTLFQPKIDRVQNRGTFLRTVIYQYSGNNQVENSFLELVTFQFHARMLNSDVAQSVKSYGHFRTLGLRSFSVTAMLNFSGKANTTIHGLGEDDAASLVSAASPAPSPYCWPWLICETLVTATFDLSAGVPVRTQGPVNQRTSCQTLPNMHQKGSDVSISSN